MITQRMHKINKKELGDYEPRFFCDVYIAFFLVVIKRLLGFVLITGSAVAVIHANYTFWPMMVSCLQQGTKMEPTDINVLSMFISVVSSIIAIILLGASLNRHLPPLYRSLKGRCCKPIPDGYFKEEKK